MSPDLLFYPVSDVGEAATRLARRELCGCDRPALAGAQQGTAKLSRLTAGPSRAAPKATCGTGNGAACWPARSGEALPAAARLVQRLAVDPADDGFENLHSAPAPRNGLRCAKFRSAASSHSRNAVWRVKLGVYAGFYTLLTARLGSAPNRRVLDHPVKHVGCHPLCRRLRTESSSNLVHSCSYVPGRTG